jgi:hypothetical protein
MVVELLRPFRILLPRAERTIVRAPNVSVSGISRRATGKDCG